MMNNNTKNMNTNEYLDEIGKRLYEISIQKNWGVEKLSEESGVSYRQLYDILYGHSHDMKLSTLVRISQNLDEPITNLLGITKNPIEEYTKALFKIHSEVGAYLKRGVAL